MRDYKKMLEEINDIVQTDEAERLVDHKWRTDPSKAITQEEARKMSDMLCRIYMIAHGITCICGEKYEIKN